MPSKPLVITLGESGGIGVCGLLRLFSKKKLPTFYLIAPTTYVNFLIRQFHLPVRINPINSPTETLAHQFNVLPTVAQINPVLGKSTLYNALATLESIHLAVAHTQAHLAKAMITLPINKHTLIGTKKWPFVGHTEYLQYKTNSKTVVMMMATKQLKTVPLTTHIPLTKVTDYLTVSEIVNKITIVYETFQPLGETKFLITGVNPHASDNGTFSNEEETILKPAINILKKQGIIVEGPVAADSAFIPRIRESYDTIFTPTHDQALIPIKALYFDKTVNVTLGLPFIRTSPDHGPALDLALTPEKVNLHSIYASIILADELVHRLVPTF